MRFFLFLVCASVLGFLVLPTTAHAQGGTRVLVLYHSDAPGQKSLRAFAHQGAEAGIVRIVECDVVSLDGPTKRIPSSLAQLIKDTTDTMLADGTLTDGMVMLQAYALVSSGRQIDATPFGERVLAGNNSQVEQVIKDVAAGIPPSPLRKAKVWSWVQLLFYAVGWVTGLTLIYGLYLFHEGQGKFVYIVVPAVVIVISGILSPKGAADFAVTSILIPLACLFGLWLILQCFRGLGWMLGIR